MSRLTAWIASRRQQGRSRRAPRAGAPAVRPLGFERYEQRIALSTNAVWYDWSPELKSGDGGTLTLFSGVPATTNSTLNSNVFITRGSIQISPNSWDPHGVQFFDVTGDANSADLNLDGAEWSSAAPEVLVVDSRVVHIPPPAVELPGNEGGQISLTPFTGPSMLGLTPSKESTFAQSRPGLAPTRVTEDSPTTPALSPADSLQGRAIVYEVAHAKSQSNAAGESQVATTAAREQLQVSLAVPLAPLATRHVAASSRATHAASSADPSADAAAVNAAQTQPVAMQQLHATQAAGQLEQVLTTGDSQPTTAESHAALDAALEQWESTADREPREALAAPVDGHQRRLIGGALIAIAAVPAAKAVRRARHHSAEEHPRKGR